MRRGGASNVFFFYRAFLYSLLSLRSATCCYGCGETGTLNLKPDTLNPKPDTLNPKPDTLNLKPDTLNPAPSTVNLHPTRETLNSTQKTEECAQPADGLIFFSKMCVLFVVMLCVTGWCSSGRGPRRQTRKQAARAMLAAPALW